MPTQSVIKQSIFLMMSLQNQLISSYRCTGNFSSFLGLKAVIYMVTLTCPPIKDECDLK